jgi:hypothetical protein
MESCANCERKIGNLETPMAWRDKVVCGDCYSFLSRQGRIDYTTAPLGGPPNTVQTASPPPDRRIDSAAVADGVAAGIGKVIAVILLILFIVMCLGIILSKMS